ncbi:MAG: hypothetical protein KGO22_08525 [Gammaproteobacteria bacterium]|nr:hypothetical protein [Gammaproteobacteria bacterium]
MTDVFGKLNLKDQREILVVDAPESFEEELAALDEVRIVRRPAAANRISFGLIFVTRKAQLDAFVKVLAAKAEGDPVIWFAYPKGTSKSLVCDFNRDTGWDAVRAAGLDSVRQVAIDADWSALRFRRVEFINRRS